MEVNKIKENQDNYNSILQKINHKPLIIEKIFPYIKEEPYKFLNVIDKDHTLKENLNSIFYDVKKNNLISKDFNDYLALLKAFKIFKERFGKLKDTEKDLPDFKNTTFEKYILKSDLNSSFIEYQTKYIFEKIEPQIEIKPSFSSLTEISFFENTKYEHIKLVFLPSDKHKYPDGLYISNILNSANINSLNKEIDVLYCIIDDNEYYLNNIPSINENVIINEVYFIVRKGIKVINYINAIEKYLGFLNKKNIKQITLGSSFFDLNINNTEELPIVQITNDVLIKNKKLSIPNSINIKFEVDLPNYNNSKVYLGLYFLFNKHKINGFLEIDSKNYQPDLLAKIEGTKIDFLIIKYKGYKAMDDKNYQEFVNKCLKIDSHMILFYITNESKKNKINDEINLKLDDKFIEDKSFMIYSEVPAKKTPIGKFGNYIVTDIKDNLIFQENLFDRYENINHLISNLIFLEKYKNVCFKYIFDSEIGYKIYLFECKGNYNIYVETQNDDYDDYINPFIEYCEENYKIAKITRYTSPLSWKEIINENKNVNITQQKKKGFGGKLNQKQMLEYELEEDEYPDEDENEEGEK